MALIDCQECGNEVSTEAETCPHCGFPLDSEAKEHPEEKDSEQKGISPIVVWGCGCFGLIFAFSVFMIIAIALNPSSDGQVDLNEANIQQSIKKLKVIESHVESGEYGSRYIVGKVKNNSDDQYSYVSVEFNLYDSQGNQIGSTMDNVSNLEPESTWRFKALVHEEGTTSYKLKEISGY